MQTETRAGDILGGWKLVQEYVGVLTGGNRRIHGQARLREPGSLYARELISESAHEIAYRVDYFGLDQCLGNTRSMHARMFLVLGLSLRAAPLRFPIAKLDLFLSVQTSGSPWNTS